MPRPISEFRFAFMFLAVTCSFAGNFAYADVRLPKLFSDHMVLQREIAAPVWGWADPGESVTVTLGDQTTKATTDAAGRWRVQFTNLVAGGPHALTVSGKNKIQVNDVLVGEVWLGSGQSNMAMSVHAVKQAMEEKAAANLPQLRMFVERGKSSPMPLEDAEGEWTVCSPERVGNFSATAYFFGRDLHRTLKVPVGLIASSVGGTPIQAWIDTDVQRNEPKLREFFVAHDQQLSTFDAEQARKIYEARVAAWKKAVEVAKQAGKNPPRAPLDPITQNKRKADIGGLFKGKIAPLVGYGIRGAIWYQGEANSAIDKAPFYETQLRLLVTDWRSRWGYDFPFAWVQLPNYDSPNKLGWVLVREQMLKALALPKSGMAVTIDIGDDKDIHPRNKQDVGKRLALWARATVYGEKISYSGPSVASHTPSDGAIRIRFDHADGGLKAREGDNLLGFEVAGSDKSWQPASARIEGDAVVVAAANVSAPIAVRYAWKAPTDANLINGAGLPASPFRLGDAP